MARSTVRNAYVSSWLSVNERPTSVSRAVVSVRKYLVNAVAELRAREAAEPDE